MTTAGKRRRPREPMSNTSSILTERRPSLLPPDPRAGRRRFGPMLLAMLGIAGSSAVYAFRDRLRPLATAGSPIAVAIPAKTAERPCPLVEASAAPLAGSVLPTHIAPPQRPAIDAFANAPSPQHATSPDASLFALQSIVIGRLGATCLIDGKALRVGDAIGNGRIRSIHRGEVTIRFGNGETTLRLESEKHPPKTAKSQR